MHKECYTCYLTSILFFDSAINPHPSPRNVVYTFHEPVLFDLRCVQQYNKLICLALTFNQVTQKRLMTYMYTKELESTNKTNNEIVKNSLEYICSL